MESDYLSSQVVKCIAKMAVFWIIVFLICRVHKPTLNEIPMLLGYTTGFTFLILVPFYAIKFTNNLIVGFVIGTLLIGIFCDRMDKLQNYLSLSNNKVLWIFAALGILYNLFYLWKIKTYHKQLKLINKFEDQKQS